MTNRNMGELINIRTLDAGAYTGSNDLIAEQTDMITRARLTKDGNLVLHLARNSDEFIYTASIPQQCREAICPLVLKMVGMKINELGGLVFTTKE
jgi:hypothetical protein